MVERVPRRDRHAERGPQTLKNSAGPPASSRVFGRPGEGATGPPARAGPRRGSARKEKKWGLGPAGASCHGNACQGQGDRTPERARGPTLGMGCCRASRPTTEEGLHDPCQIDARLRFFSCRRSGLESWPRGVGSPPATPLRSSPDRPTRVSQSAQGRRGMRRARVGRGFSPSSRARPSLPPVASGTLGAREGNLVPPPAAPRSRDMVPRAVEPAPFRRCRT